MKHYLSAILGFAIWGTFALVLKPLSAFPALDILITRVIIASISIVAACFLFRRRPTIDSIKYIKHLSKNDRLKLILNIVLSALMLSLNWFSFIYVMNAVSVNATSLAYLICPILTTVLASLFLKEKLNKGQWFAVILSIASCIILAYGHFIDLVYSMVIALSYATYLILQKNKYKLDKFFALTLHIVVCAIFLLPILTVIDTSTPKTDSFYLFVAIIAIGYTIIPLFLNNFALKKLDSSVVGSLLYLNPIISFLLAVFYYKESINMLQITGFSLIFIAVVVFNVSYFSKNNIISTEK
jgi:chloramphenicol-sensitive protein RarD